MKIPCPTTQPIQYTHNDIIRLITADTGNWLATYWIIFCTINITLHLWGRTRQLSQVIFIFQIFIYTQGKTTSDINLYYQSSYSVSMSVNSSPSLEITKYCWSSIMPSLFTQPWKRKINISLFYVTGVTNTVLKGPPNIFSKSLLIILLIWKYYGKLILP